MRHYAYVFLMSLFALVRTVTAAADDSILWIDVSGYKLTEADELRPLESLGGLSVTPGEGHVYSNASSYTSNQNTFTASVPFGYRVSKWTKAYDDPFVFTQGEDVEGSEGATSVTIPWDSRGRHVYLALILELDDNRTVTLGKSPFGAGTIGTNYGTYACMKGDVFQLNARPDHDPATGFDRSVFRRWSDGVTTARRNVVVDTNLTLVAEFVPKSWEVSFDANGGSVCPTSKWVTCDACYGWLPTPVMLGHKFDGWFRQLEDGELVGFETTVGAVGDHFLHARWTPASYTLDYRLAGEGNGLVEGVGAYLFGEHATLTAKPYEGSVFAGWEDGETRNPRVVDVNSNAVYGVQFDIATYDVTFTYRNREGKEVVSAVQTVRHGEAATPPAASECDSWPDHYFKTWSSDAYKSVKENLTGERSVLAIYDVETFDVTFVYHGQDGNAVTTMPQHVVAGEAAMPPTDSVADNWPGHKRTGWQPDFSVIRSDLTVEAIYDEYCTVDYAVVGEGNGKVEGVGTYLAGTTVELTAKPYEGSEFVGWEDGETRNPRRVTVTSNVVYGAVFDVKAYDVTFTYRDANGLEVSATNQVRHGGAVTPPTVPEWPHHVFKAWSSEEYREVTRNLTGNYAIRAIYDDETFAVTFVYHGRDGNAVTTMPQHVVAGASATPPPDSVADNWSGHRRTDWQPDYSVVLSNLTVTAVYEDYCTVDYAVVGEGNGKVEGIGSYLAGTTVELTAKPYEGSEFVGWEDGETRNPRRVTVTSNVVYGAVFDVKAYDVTFTYRDANGLEVVTEVQSVRHGEAAVPPDVSEYASWPYHTFKNWSTEEYKKVTRDLTGNQSVRAIYDEETFAVTFVYQGRDGNAVTTMPQHVVAGASATPPPDSVADNWAGHKRVDWQPDYSVVRSDLTVEAVYEPAVYDVDFIYFNAEGRESTQRHQVEFEGLVPFEAVSSLTNEWTGHAFRYWSIGGNEVVGDVVVSNDLRIVAVYEGSKFYEVTFVYHDRDGNEVTNQPQQVLAGTSAVPPPDSVANNWTGHTLSGWHPDYSVIQSNLVVEAEYDLNVYNVDFIYYNSEGKEDMRRERVKYGEYVPFSAVEVVKNQWPNHTFQYWSLDGKEVTEEIVVTSDLRITAVYADYVHIFYHANGGEGLVPTEIYTNYSGEVTLAANSFTKTGYVFIGWTNTTQNVLIKAGDRFNVKKGEDYHFDAYWEPVIYSLIFDGNGGEIAPDKLTNKFWTYNTTTLISGDSQTCKRKDGYYMLWGWGTKADAPWEGDEYYKCVWENGEWSVELTDLLGKDDNGKVILYAIWKSAED